MIAPQDQPDPAPRDGMAEELIFRPSPEVTLGVELELQVLDRDSGDLVPGAPRILEACAGEQLEGVSAEFLQGMLEVKTGVCRNVAEVRDTLFPRLRRVRNIARSLGYELAVGATHPYCRPSANAIFPDKRYQRQQRRLGWLAYHEATFGQHVHVGVPGPEEAIGLINLLVPYLPHLLAVSANSPFWQGVDTGYVSARVQMFRPSAHAGVPLHCGSWADFRHYCEVLSDCGIIASTKDIHWDIRPRPAIGTIEFRIFDAPPNLPMLLGLAALVRCLVVDGLRLLEERPQLRSGDASEFWLATENKWLAARFGLRAECFRRAGRERACLLDDTARLLERLAPVARETGEAGFLAALQPLDQLESGAERQRRLYRQSGDWKAVIDDMKNRWAADLESGVPSDTAAPTRADRQGNPSVPGHDATCLAGRQQN